MSNLCNPSDFQLPYTEYAQGGQNGRINFSAPVAGSAGSIGSRFATEKTSSGSLQSNNPIPGFDYLKSAEPNFVADMLRGNFNPSEVALAFFTPRNAAILQESIRRGVYEKSGSKRYRIDDQDIDELKMIMRGIYYQYAKNNIFDIHGQVKELNQLVVDWSVPRILSEVDQYNYYLKDISHLPIPLQQPISMSGAGTRSLPFQLPM